MTIVRLVVPLLANIAFDSHLVAFIKLNHAMAGIYMYLRRHSQESVPLMYLATTSVGKLCSLPALNWTSYEENDITDGRYG